jgi:hypothetical protein
VTRPACFCGIPALSRGLGEAVPPEKSGSIFVVRFVGVVFENYLTNSITTPVSVKAQIVLSGADFIATILPFDPS